MIPHIIHYCWFGGKPLPKLESKCLRSWERIVPDYKVMRWDESNFDIASLPFTNGAYRLGKYAFVADVVRLQALYDYGGFYLDTDIELLKTLDPLTDNKLVMGFETAGVIQTGLIGAEPQNPIIGEMLDYYKAKKRFDLETDGKIPNSALFADYFRDHNIPLDNAWYSQNGLLLLPSEMVCPIDQSTWKIAPTPDCYCIHYLSGSWLPRRDRFTRWMKSKVGKLIGFEKVGLLRSVIKKLNV